MIEGLKPYTYGYMYPDNTLRFSDREINGMRPLHPVPLYSLEQIDTLQKQLVKCRADVLKECARMADQNWSLMFTKAENREVARKVSAAIAKSIRDQIPHLTDETSK